MSTKPRDDRIQPWKLMNESPSSLVNERTAGAEENYAPEYSAPKSYHIVAHIKDNVFISKSNVRLNPMTKIRTPLR
ncbi:hypothetical protein FE257_008715 [Aspergillus nanangensis]|uniref:Uncharacterized protein n=1 Tax=Aspergillus nanangensis TaxID=2582783 RepID=A0AAD4CMS4_ASPNN|nr:hypothetical protein FE257_008715 [Aspergillus nanangensis]